MTTERYNILEANYETDTHLIEEKPFSPANHLDDMIAKKPDEFRQYVAVKRQRLEENYVRNVIGENEPLPCDIVATEPIKLDSTHSLSSLHHFIDCS